MTASWRIRGWSTGKCLCTGCRAEVPGDVKSERKSRFLIVRPEAGLLGMTAKTNSAKHPRAPQRRRAPGGQPAGLKAAASRTHPSERVGHPQRQRKADSSVDFSNGESRMLSPGADRVMTAAWRVRRGRNTAANACAAPAAWKAALRKKAKAGPIRLLGPRDFALGRERCSRWALNNTKGGAPAKARKADPSVDSSNGESRMLSPGADLWMTASWVHRDGAQARVPVPPDAGLKSPALR